MTRRSIVIKMQFDHADDKKKKKSANMVHEANAHAWRDNAGWSD